MLDFGLEISQVQLLEAIQSSLKSFAIKQSNEFFIERLKKINKQTHLKSPEQSFGNTETAAY